MEHVSLGARRIGGWSQASPHASLPSCWHGRRSASTSTHQTECPHEGDACVRRKWNGRFGWKWMRRGGGWGGAQGRVRSLSSHLVSQAQGVEAHGVGVSVGTWCGEGLVREVRQDWPSIVGAGPKGKGKPPAPWARVIRDSAGGAGRLGTSSTSAGHLPMYTDGEVHRGAGGGCATAGADRFRAKSVLAAIAWHGIARCCPGTRANMPVLA